MVEGTYFDEVIVSASRRAEKLQEAPAAVSVITQKNINASGGSVSPIRALINSPGVELQQQTSTQSNYPGEIDAKSLFDVTLGYALSKNLDFELSAINLFNNEFSALPGFPKIGRTVTGRLVFDIE
jgi:outer membrane cobalamin receptor